MTRRKLFGFLAIAPVVPFVNPTGGYETEVFRQAYRDGLISAAEWRERFGFLSDSD
jgi:hypothetical protein